MYRLFFRLVLSRLDPEFAHHLAFLVIRMLPTLGIGAVSDRPELHQALSNLPPGLLIITPWIEQIR